MKQLHLAGKINQRGQVSALCSNPPRAICLSTSGWVAQAKYVTCKKCLNILRDSGENIDTYSVFSTRNEKPE